MSQTEEIRCHPGLGSGCAVKEKGLELRIVKSVLSAKGKQLVSAATFQVGTGGCQADSPSLTVRVTASSMAVSYIYMVHTAANAVRDTSFNPHSLLKGQTLSLPHFTDEKTDVAVPSILLSTIQSCRC